MKSYILYLYVLITLLLFANLFVTTTTTAHNFSTDDNSIFLTLINMILIENRLINNSSFNSSDPMLFQQMYIKNINKIVDDILISEDSLLIDSDQFYNNTIIATMMANLGDEVLRKYGYAFGIPSNIMINMDFQAASNLEKNFNKTSTLNDHSRHLPQVLGNYSINLKDESQFFGALETSKRMMEIFERDLAPTDLLSQNNNPLLILNNSLIELEANIYNYSNPSKIMEIVHGKVHPNLQLAFNLTLKR